jgi:hypothetical protein
MSGTDRKSIALIVRDYDNPFSIVKEQGFHKVVSFERCSDARSGLVIDFNGTTIGFEISNYDLQRRSSIADARTKIKNVITYPYHAPNNTEAVFCNFNGVWRPIYKNHFYLDIYLLNDDNNTKLISQLVVLQNDRSKFMDKNNCEIEPCEQKNIDQSKLDLKLAKKRAKIQENLTKFDNANRAKVKALLFENHLKPCAIAAR